MGRSTRMVTCAAPACSFQSHANGYCPTHYRWHRKGKSVAVPVETDYAPCVLHGKIDCSCVINAPGAGLIGQPFEAGLWQCEAGHYEIGQPRFVMYGRTYPTPCGRCGNMMSRLKVAVVTPSC